LGACTTVVNSANVGIDVVGKNIFIAARDIHGRIGCTVPCTKMCAHGNASQLG
jgi:hypothetical protein